MKAPSVMGRYCAIAASAVVLVITGCGSDKKDQPKAGQESVAQAPASAPVVVADVPAGHPAPPSGAAPVANVDAPMHTGMKSQKAVKLSKEVLAKWNEVQLEITDGASKKKDKVTVKVGASAALKNPAFKLKVEAFVPDYMITEDSIVSRTNEADNPAVLVALLEGDKVVAKGWIFKSLPDFNSYTDQRFPVALIGPSSAGKKK
ncbi:MAG: hypothetical protein A3J24_06065 [Deltaproteobacteria bacterium RIFCSPLOWO2_02_FULL_53_8]|nr:MAG: hypothetical protein A3J24_06065 [Deltaproteobacteria bacterium RIFCSPLOWO2_02_FULL_53_8]